MFEKDVVVYLTRNEAKRLLNRGGRKAGTFIGGLVVGAIATLGTGIGIQVYTENHKTKPEIKTMNFDDLDDDEDNKD